MTVEEVHGLSNLVHPVALVQAQPGRRIAELSRRPGAVDGQVGRHVGQEPLEVAAAEGAAESDAGGDVAVVAQPRFDCFVPTAKSN